MKAEQLFNVTDKVVVVTGGANGLGFAIATALSDNGAKVVLMDVDAAQADKAVAELTGRGRAASAEIADLSNLDAVRAGMDAIATREGGIDVVFANAGITAGPGYLGMDGQRDPNGFIEAIPDDLWDRVIDINLTGVFATVRAAVPHLKKRGKGRIVITTSTAASKTSPAIGTAYPTTKAAAAHLMRNAAVELAPFGITVNAIQPGPFQTRITTPELIPIFEASSPSHRIGQTTELEGAALFFASDASDFVTGAQFNLDGGQLLGRAD